MGKVASGHAFEIPEASLPPQMTSVRAHCVHQSNMEPIVRILQLKIAGRMITGSVGLMRNWDAGEDVGREGHSTAAPIRTWEGGRV